MRRRLRKCSLRRSEMFVDGPLECVSSFRSIILVALLKELSAEFSSRGAINIARLTALRSFSRYRAIQACFTTGHFPFALLHRLMVRQRLALSASVGESHRDARDVLFVSRFALNAGGMLALPALVETRNETRVEAAG